MNNLTALNSSPNPLKILTNISCFKKVIKGFKTSDMDTLVKVLMYQPKLINSCLTKGFVIEDANFFKLSCKVHYNIPLVSFAWFGLKKGYSLKLSEDKELSVNDFDREQLLDYLKTKKLPNKIIPINLEIRQTINNVESTFTYKMNSK